MALKYFDEWTTEGVEIRDAGLKMYIRLEPTLVLHGGGRQAGKQFGKATVPIVERLMNKLMRSGPGAGKLRGKVIRGVAACGKKNKAHEIVRRSFKKIAEQTKKNPLQVLINAVQNSAPREETTRIRYGGITYYVAVDSAPQRRLDIALKNLADGAFVTSFSSKKPIEDCLVGELILAANNDMKSFAVARKDEMERISKGAR